MKKWFCLICAIAFILSACSNEETTIPQDTANFTNGIYELTFSAERIFNNSVGNDWEITYKHNGKEIENGYQILLPLEIFEFQTIEVEIREKDKIDDVSSEKINIGVCDGGGSKARITVEENNGRYKGNTAEWEIICGVKLVGKQ